MAEQDQFFHITAGIVLTRKVHLHNADVVKKFIFRYLSVPLTDGLWNIFMIITNKDIPNKSSS
jgi:hypothetical protein